MSFAVPRLLERRDDLTAFSCGKDSLDVWARNYARQSHSSGSARVYVTHDNRSPHVVVGYYSLSTATIGKAAATPPVGRDMSDPVPALLIGRLAVDRKHQGSGLGAQLLSDAIRRTLTAAEVVGIRVLLVHALDDDAAAWYRKYDFDPSPLDDRHLMLLLKHARKSL